MHGIRLSGPALGRPKKDEIRDKLQDYMDQNDRVEVERRISLALSSKKFNYKIEHMTQILGSDVMKYKPKGEIEEFARKQLALYDKL